MAYLDTAGLEWCRGLLLGHEFLTLMCLECHVATRPQLLPDPQLDPISALVFSITQDLPPEIPSPQHLKVAGVDLVTRTGLTDLAVLHVDSEADLLEEAIRLVTTWDPDMLVGYEVQRGSWGYLLERGLALGVEVVARLSRVPEGARASHHLEEEDEYGTEHTSQIHLAGRVVLNAWRLMRSEAALQSYTLQSVAFQILHTRIPAFSHTQLTAWWLADTTRGRTLGHLLLRCRLTLDLLHRLDLVPRTAELARLFGIQFYDVLSRGTQFRVESMMLRLARGRNMVAISPSVQQRAAMKAPEWIPLTLEPLSRFYTEPVVVLDFQSLYPSVMIAYNYCYSTCLGRIHLLHNPPPQPYSFGTAHLRLPPDPKQLLEMVDEMNVSPCGVAFLPSRVRRGVLPVMLEEILNTRLMVKASLKRCGERDASLRRVLHSRQLGLKLIANVTYGYTSANFSGRMPCSEIGDSVVSKGREILERSIQLVNSHPTWAAQVVYGDTDSLFVHLPGRSRSQAFVTGQEIAAAVTKMYPKPIKLKFEKVYLPCLLQTKKRYVGYMYETPDQQEPVFDAKGIETVRRDGCPAVAKVLERSLHLLFDRKDVSLVRQYVQRQLLKVMQGRVSLQDLTFAKEYRGARGYRPGACVPALQLARQWTRRDPRKEPRAGERVPYVIVYGAPGLPLIQLVRCPSTVLADASLRLNATYYITHAILPPLHRCLALLGVNVNAWYTELPRPSTLTASTSTLPGSSSGPSIARYFTPVACVGCGADTTAAPAGRGAAGGQGLCGGCKGSPQETVLRLGERFRTYERAVDHIRQVSCSLEMVCEACVGCRLQEVECISLDCPLTHRRTMAGRDLQAAHHLHSLLDDF
ncbi:DNA polymerase zeta catalytic subunit [Chionoecetes opilio]|uniref:DNA polymerase n=1 Tax=Chionoecetes opilio TaxID=41210 RepID=A0A8J4Y746_CHIOP|nr:DNA polymerase zeta catalytic subunit [Chionoecetes opilio]